MPGVLGCFDLHLDAIFYQWHPYVSRIQTAQFQPAADPAAFGCTEMSDPNSTDMVIFRASRSWLWITVIVMSGLCSGVSGLYTGSFITGQKCAVQAQALHNDYDKRLTDQHDAYEQELARIDRNTQALSAAINELGGKVADVSQQVGQVSDKVTHNNATAVQTAAQAAAVASSALKSSQLANAKADVLSAKVDKKTAPTPAAPPKAASDASSTWWHGSTKRD
jgi:hypothetical protein